MNRASWTQKDLQSAGEVFLEKRLSLRKARRGPISYKISLIFTLPALIIYSHIIS
jgi:hypothetical protein